MKSVDSESEKNFLMWDMIKKAELKKEPSRNVHGKNSKMWRKVFTVTFRRSIGREWVHWQESEKAVLTVV